MKNEYRGLVAVGLCIGVWLLWFKVIVPLPPVPDPKRVEPSKSVGEVEQVGPEAKQTVPSLSPNLILPVRRGGEEFVLENSLVKITLDTDGGVLKNWELKKFSKNGVTGQTVSLAEFQGNILELALRKANSEIPAPIPFTISKRGIEVAELRWSAKGATLLKKFQLLPDSYQVKMDVEFINNTNKTLTFTPTMDWTKIPVEESPQRGALFFKTPPDRWHPIYYLDGSFTVVNEEKVPALEFFQGKTNWVGAESRYFLGSIIPLGQQAQGVELGKYQSPSGEPLFFTRMVLPPVSILPGERWLQAFDVYGGPKDLKNLKNIGSNLNEAIGYGWITVVAVPILFLLQFFYHVVHNYGLSIILLTILIKVLLNPINRKSMESMKRMQVLQPKLKEFREKYGNDKQRINQETMQLFKTHKVNPMGGCLPMLLQFPIYIALYQVLWNSVELYQAPFFWFYKDLSAPDPYFISPILLGVAMVIQTKMTPNPSADPTQQKMMMMMPLLFSGMMLFLPMGLVLYILVNTGMTILQQWMYTKGIRFRDLLRGQFRASA